MVSGGKTLLMVAAIAACLAYYFYNTKAANDKVDNDHRTGIMGFLGQMLVIFSAIVAVWLAYCIFYNPGPADMDKPWLYSVFLRSFRLMESIFNILDLLGIDKKPLFQKVSRRSDNWQARMSGDHPEIKATETTMDGVPVVIYELRQVSAKPRPGLIHIHGGGYSVGSARSARQFLTSLVRETDIFAVSVNYRLTPQHPHPAALEDCVAVSKYVFSHAKDLGVDPKRIGVAGESAGGNMAAVLSLVFRDMGSNPQFMYQVLIVPWTQAVNLNLPSYDANQDYNIKAMDKEGIATYILSYAGKPLSYIDKVVRGEHISTEKRAQIQKYISSANIPSEYVGDAHKTDPQKEIESFDKELEAFVLDPKAYPLMAKSLANLPPALVATMGYDTIRDDGLLYLQRLRHDGVEVVHYHDEKGFHLAFYMTDSLLCNSGIRLHDAIIKYIKNQLERQ